LDEIQQYHRKVKTVKQGVTTIPTLTNSQGYRLAIGGRLK